MITTAPLESRAMAKDQVQKAAMIPRDLYRLVQAIEKSTGASHSRITVAALISYLLRDFPDVPQPAWMRSAVQLEQRDLDLADLFLSIATDKLQVIDEQFTIYKQTQKQRGQPIARSRQFDYDMTSGAVRYWINLIADAKKQNKDPIAAIIEEYGSRSQASKPTY